MTAPDRCPTCDSAEWPSWSHAEAPARALAAEADAAKWRAAIDRTAQPGDPVLRAIAELLHCTYLDAVPTPADDDRRREIAGAARIAHDANRDRLGVTDAVSVKRDAAKWRKVAPLIEALRDVEHDAQWDHERMAKAVDAVLCAAKDPHP